MLADALFVNQFVGRNLFGPELEAFVTDLQKIRGAESCAVKGLNSGMLERLVY